MTPQIEKFSTSKTLDDFQRGDRVRYKPQLENERGFVHLVTQHYVFVRFYQASGGISHPKACEPGELVREVDLVGGELCEGRR